MKALIMQRFLLALPYLILDGIAFYVLVCLPSTRGNILAAIGVMFITTISFKALTKAVP